jgi:hypothetical protein
MRFRRVQQGITRLLQRDPDPAAIIAAALVAIGTPVAAFIAIPALMKIIVIRMIVEAHARRMAIAAFGMPAIAIAVAGDIGGRRGSKRHHGTGAGNDAKQKSSDFHEMAFLKRAPRRW